MKSFLSKFVDLCFSSDVTSYARSDIGYPYDVTVTRRESEGFGFVIISSVNKAGSTIGKYIVYCFPVAVILVVCQIYSMYISLHILQVALLRAVLPNAAVSYMLVTVFWQ